MAAFPPPVTGPSGPLSPPRSLDRVFWVAVAVAAVVAGLGAWMLTRPDDTAVEGPDRAVQTVESRPLEANAGASVGEGGVDGTPAPGDPQSIAPGPSADPTGVLTCTSPFGWSLTVPDGWFEVSCGLFAPYPITETDPTLSSAPVQVMYLDGTWEEVIVVATPDDRAVVGQAAATVAGRRALVVSSVQTGPGWYEPGTAVYEVWVDDGGRVVVLTTFATDGDLSQLTPVVDAMAASLTV